MRSPVTWFGGKARLAGRLSQMLGEHQVYVEVFGGGASLLFAKDPCAREIYNDLDSGLVNFFRVLRDKEKCRKLKRKLIFTPYSREEYYHCMHSWRTEADEIQKAYFWFLALSMAFGAKMDTGWGYGKKGDRGEFATEISRVRGKIALMNSACERLLRVVIEQNDWRKILDTYDSAETLFYLDPPYYPATRKNGKYNHELSALDHEELAEMLLKIKGKAMLSGYGNPTYARLEAAGWTRTDFKNTCQFFQKGRDYGDRINRIDSVWRNY